jgi:hypothetical protein
MLDDVEESRGEEVASLLESYRPSPYLLNLDLPGTILDHHDRRLLAAANTTLSRLSRKLRSQ